MVKQRVNQWFFRRAVLAAYGARCCITGLDVPQLLVAGHIAPWSKDKQNRVNPQNGICLIRSEPEHPSQLSLFDD